MNKMHCKHFAPLTEGLHRPIGMLVITTVMTAALSIHSAETNTLQSAEADFKNGVSLFEADRYAEALTFFETSYETVPRGPTLFNMAMCNKALMNNPEAVVQFERFLETYSDDSNLTADAKTALDELLRLVGLVEISGLAAGAEVQINSRIVGTAPFDTPLVLNPGVHKLTAGRYGYIPLDMSISVSAGARNRVWAEMKKLPARTSVSKPAAPSPIAAQTRLTPLPVQEARRPRKTASILTGSAGLAALGAGIFFSVRRKTNREQGDLAAEYSEQNTDPLKERIYEDNYNESVVAMKRDEIGMAVCYGIGGVLFVTTVILWATDRRRNKKEKSRNPPVARGLTGIGITF